jgi:hypothetical protein
MKKFVLPVLFLLIIFSCQKKDNVQFTNHESTAVFLDKNAKSATCLITVQTGHDASGCKGCVTLNGLTFHMECMGQGNACTNSSLMSLVQISGNNYTATTLDSTALTNEDFFNMPSRSLFVEYDINNKEVWLNIPAQLVYRDSTTLQFTFTGLYYSNSAVFNND